MATTVFRTDDASKEWIWQEIQAGRLRQGWGAERDAFTARSISFPKSDRRMVSTLSEAGLPGAPTSQRWD